MIIGQKAEGGSKTGLPGGQFMALSLLALAALVPACADAPPPPAETPATQATPAAAKPLPPLPRSSIAAVVQHRGELGLTDEQIEAMEKRDREREEEDRALRAEDDKKRKAAQEASQSAANAQNAAPPGRAPGGGMRGGGMGGGAMRGGGMGGPPGRHGPGTDPGKPAGDALDDRLDADDTKAYLDIEDLLTPAQREPAREIASDYRAQLYDRRQQHRGDGSH